MPVVRHLTADEFGCHIGKYSERLKVTHKGEVRQQAPLMHLQTVTLVGGGVGISSDAVAACCERGIPIYMLSALGDVYGLIFPSAINGTVLARREQMLAYFDDRAVTLAISFSTAKMKNQARTLRYWGRNRRDNHPDHAAQLSQAAAEIDADVNRVGQAALPADREQVAPWLMGMEGTAARRYWSAVSLIVPADYGWQGRIGRGATDPVNSLLNYGYGMLYAEVQRAILLAGLDPYAGFLHADRPGKPSLVLDLIEEFRQIIVDRVVIGLVARHYTIEMDVDNRLTQNTRRDFAGRILHQLEGKARYRGKRHLLRHIIQNQARSIAAFLRREADYIPYLMED